MATTSHSQPRIPTGTRSALLAKHTEPASTRLHDHARLKETLTQQRAALLSEWNLTLGLPEEQEPCADLSDRATSDLAKDLALRVRMRVMAKLKRIERTLLLVETKHYGRCRRCHKTIPYERLAAQPDARFCVPCLSRIESRAARN